MGSYSPVPEPQVLPPDHGFEPAPQPVRKQRPVWVAAPATHLLVGINCAVFLLMVANRVSAFNPSPEHLMHWGANNAGSVLIQSQWWRIVTAMFVHGGIIHLAANMWCLWNLGLLAEPLLGATGVFSAYILTGAAGNLLSTLLNWMSFNSYWVKYKADWIVHHATGSILDPTQIFPPSVGASGAVFGIAGALIVLLGSDRLPVPPDELRKLRRSVFYFAAINLLIGLSINFGPLVARTGVIVDNSAHIGGVLCGLIFAAPLVPRFGSPRSLFLSRLRIAIAMTAGLLVLFGFYIVNVAG